MSCRYPEGLDFSLYSFPNTPYILCSLKSLTLLLLKFLWEYKIIWVSILIFLRPFARKLPHNHPPWVPATIPFMGHGLQFLFDNARFLSKVIRAHPSHDIKTISVGGRYMYVCTDVDLTSRIYNSEKVFSFVQLERLLFGGFGCSARELQVLEGGVSLQIRRLYPTYLQGKSLSIMNQVFLETLKANIRSQFPSGGNCVEMDLVAFMRKQWTTAAITSQFGSQFLVINGRDKVVEWLWEFDGNLRFLFTGLPDFVKRKAAESRETGLKMLIAWERAAIETSPEITGEKLWDESWGLRLLRERSKLMKGMGFSERGRAAVQLVFLWGANANAIPVASWLVIQALSNSALLPALLHEIDIAKSETTLNFSNLEEGTKMWSLLMECYRWSVYSPGVRTVEEDVDVGPYRLLKGGMVLVHARTLQLDRDIWGDNAHIFDASRFLGNGYETQDNIQVHEQTNREEKRRKRSMKHFGGGTHYCPGRYSAGQVIVGGFAVLMETLQVEVVLEKFKTIGMPKPDIETGKQGGLWPDRDFWVRMKRK